MKTPKETIFSFQLKNSIISSRIFLAPINTGFSYNGDPTPNLLQFHSERSGKKIAISYVGNVAIDSDFVTNKNTLFFTKNLNQWKKITNEIYENGSLPGIQIACRNTKLKPPRRWLNSDINHFVNETRAELSSYSESFLNSIIDKFIHAAKTAHAVGFKVIQIHAAHGYFISQHLNDELNTRSDIFGRCKTLVLNRIVEGIRSALPNVILDIRFSLLDGLKQKSVELKQKEFVLHEIANMDFDIISISNGIYDIDKQLIYPPVEWGHSPFISMVLPFASQYPNKLWNIAGNIWDLSLLPNSIPSNLSFSVGRSLIADPNFVIKSVSGLKETMQVCTRTNFCHYFSRNSPHIVCPVAKDLNHFL